MQHITFPVTCVCIEEANISLSVSRFLSCKGLPALRTGLCNGCLRNTTKQNSCHRILTLLKSACLANAVELNIYFLVSIMTVTKGLNQI